MTDVAHTGAGSSSTLFLEEIVHSLRSSGKGHREVAGFAVVASFDPQNPNTLHREHARRIANGFVGPEATPTVGGNSPGVQWVAAKPGAEQTLSTLSCADTDGGLCIVEGEFYSDVDGYRPKAGVDDRLASLILDRILHQGWRELRLLNGTFCGVVFLHNPLRVFLFVDRLGVRFLYYRKTPTLIEISTNIYGFRHGVALPRVDPHALNEHLILGYPTESKTLFSDISLVPPSRVLEISAAQTVQHRYFDLPERRKTYSLHDAVHDLCSAIDTHVNDISFGPPECGIAFSGGKDSRAILSSLLRTGKKPHALVYSTGEDDAEAQLALTILSELGVPRHRVTLGRGSDPSLFDLDSSLLEDGYAAGWGFLAVAGATTLFTPNLLTGFSGDPISGYWSGILPWKMRSLEDLAMAELEHRGEEVPAELVQAGLVEHLRIPTEEVFSAWVKSFHQEYHHDGDFTSAFLRQRFDHRNRRRIAVIFRAMRLLSTPIHPFADGRVLEAYGILPLRLLVGQQAHCYVAFHGVPALGAHSTGGLPIAVSLKQEAQFAAAIHHSMRLLRRLRSIGRALRPPAPSVPELTPRHDKHLQIAIESGLFDPDVLRSWYTSGRISGNAVIKLGATALHIGCAMGKLPPSAPEPVFVKGL